ncbi:lysylphosphatidylglycerol synthase transmembrane domain-containing protein [Geomesophilobacter sediminis]|uniref:Flippase-like domain-containing protein n=1 Tax=Geomesophilobacter sediminis TaxID=2798584 RepID=A0A8J7LY14_9BACT|nr:lysylphosphatidylglycerol synthase transmembrane domain-containing protein [Geomesophilobacter sediminis]MBJ6724096.1 flippase-like domain-containing protein [Geomesophilobacter sediminis]
MIKGKADFKLWAGIGVSAFFLFLLFRSIDPDKLLSALKEMDYRYLLPALVLTFVSYFMRAVRWKYLLLPVKETRLGTLFSSTLIGYMANNLLPARLGELVRAYSLAKKENIPTPTVFATLVLDRLCDGFSVLLILVVAFFSVQLPPGMEKIQHGLVTGGYVTLALYIAVLGFLVLLTRLTDWTLGVVAKILGPFPERFRTKVLELLSSFLGGIRFPKLPGEISGIIVTSVLIWATAVWPVDLVLRSFGIALPITASMFIMVFLVFAVMVPASPGYVGTYHFACVTALSAFRIPTEKALSVALVIHAMGFFPVIVAGLFVLWRDKVSLSALSHETEVHEG